MKNIDLFLGGIQKTLCSENTFNVQYFNISLGIVRFLIVWLLSIGKTLVANTGAVVSNSNDGKIYFFHILLYFKWNVNKCFVWVYDNWS